jgi:ubiquinone/menaquinone biosynthesis C-methylase UbiE
MVDVNKNAAIEPLPPMGRVTSATPGSPDGSEGRTTVEAILGKQDIHQKWIEKYRNPDNEEFYNHAFARICEVIGPPEGKHILDAGCGSLSHAMRFARRGYRLTAVDFSESVLETARSNLQDKPDLGRQISLQRQDILNLPFEDETFTHVLCWGVLMHIPDVERAISELCRVLKDGGYFIVGEGSMRSLQALVQRLLLSVSSKRRDFIRITPAGVEMWRVTDGGRMLTRQANIGWLKQTLGDRGFVVKNHWPGQFTELYSKTSSPRARALIHKFNNLWFEWVNRPFFSHGNIIVLQKILSPNK